MNSRIKLGLLLLTFKSQRFLEMILAQRRRSYLPFSIYFSQTYPPTATNHS